MLPISLTVNPNRDVPGVTYTNRTKNRFQFRLNEELVVPEGSLLAVQSASLYYSFPNVPADTQILLDDGANQQAVDIPAGFYTFRSLSALFKSRIGADFGAYDIRLVAYEFNERCAFRAVLSGAETLEITLGALLRPILGFPGNSPIQLTAAAQEAIAADRAMFDEVNGVIVTCPTLLGRSVNVYNGLVRSNVLCHFPITVTPMRHQVYQPPVAVKIPCDAGRYRDLEFEVLSQRGGDLNLNNEFSITMFLELA